MTNDMRSSFGIVDDGSTNKTIQKVQQFDKAIGQVEESVLDLPDVFLEFEKQADGTFKAVGAKFSDLREQLDDQPSPDEPDGNKKIPSTDFGKTAGALKGLAGASSLVAGEAGAATGQMLNLASVAPDMADQIGKLGQGMTLTSGLIGVGLVAAVGLGAAALHEFNKAAEETAKQVNAAKDAQFAYIDALSSTSDDLNAQLEDNVAALENNRLKQEAVRKAIEDLDEPTDKFFELGDWLGFVGDAGDKLSDELKELEQGEQDLIASTEGVTEALNSQEIAANDAAKALEEEGKALIDQAADIGNLTKFRQQAMEVDEQGRKDLAKGIANERESIEAQLSVLRQSASQTDDTRERISELEGELGRLDDQTKILNSDAVDASVAQKELASAMEEVSDVSKKVADEQQKLSDLEADRMSSVNDMLLESAQIAAEAQSEIAATRAEAQSELRQFDEEQRQTALEDELEHQDALARIRDEARINERDLLLSDDFIKAFFAKEKETEALANERKAFDKETMLRNQQEEKKRVQLIAGFTQELTMAKAASDQKLAQQGAADLQELMNLDNKVAEQESVVRDAENEVTRIMQDSAQERVQLAGDVAQAQINFMSQVAQMANQLTSGIGNVPTGGNIASQNIAGAFNDFGGTTMQEQMAELAQMTAGLI
jgi:hypothetical protein